MDDKLRSYSLPTQSIPELRLSDHLADLLEFKGFLDGRGIRTENTRIERYIEYLTHAANGAPEDGLRAFTKPQNCPWQSSIDLSLYVLREAHGDRKRDGSEFPEKPEQRTEASA